MEYENDLNDSEISEEDYDPLDELLYFLKTLGKFLKSVIIIIIFTITFLRNSTQISFRTQCKNSLMVFLKMREFTTKKLWII